MYTAGCDTTGCGTVNAPGVYLWVVPDSPNLVPPHHPYLVRLWPNDPRYYRGIGPLPQCSGSGCQPLRVDPTVAILIEYIGGLLFATVTR